MGLASNLASGINEGVTGLIATSSIDEGSYYVVHQMKENGFKLHCQQFTQVEVNRIYNHLQFTLKRKCRHQVTRLSAREALFVLVPAHYKKEWKQKTD